jgi:tRNA(Ile)-lysidine synthase
VISQFRERTVNAKRKAIRHSPATARQNRNAGLAGNLSSGTLATVQASAKSERAPSFLWINLVEKALANRSRHETYLIGFSGGLDSRVLLELLLQFGFSRLVVCHLNHNLRGSTSQADAEFVERLAKRLKLSCYSKTVKTWPRNRSIETAARFARHRFFAEAAKEFNTDRIFLAHHADDQVETFLFNILRGTGSLGNAVMEAETSLQVGHQSLLVLRPFLQVWKSDLQDYANHHRLQLREDVTNTETLFTRNRIRNLLIPEIENVLGRPVKRALFRLSEVAREEAKLLDEMTPKIWEQETLPVREIRSLPVALQRRVIYRWLNQLEIADAGFDEVEAVRELVEHDKPAKTNLPQDRFCRRRAGKLFVERKRKH